MCDSFTRNPGDCFGNGSGYAPPEETGSRVRLTLTGFVGDCAWESPAPLLFARGESFSRLTRSEADYRTALATHEQVQLSRSLILTESGDDVMAGCMGYDNTCTLPPFLPNGRGEEAFFGSMLAKCCAPAQIAYLPVASVHAPSGTRAFSTLGYFRPALTVLMVTSFCMAGCKFDSDDGEIGRFQSAGEHLLNIGSSSHESFTDFIAESARAHSLKLINQLEMRLHSEDDQPLFWARDVAQLVGALRSAVIDPLHPTLADFGLELSAYDAYRRARGFVRKLGELLLWWPEMLKAARELRESGIRLGVAPRERV